MSDIVERLRNPAWIHTHVSVNARAELDEDQAVDDMKDAAAEIERLRIRERELLHWLQQAQVKAENAKQKAILARDAANHAVGYALDAELAANSAITTSQRGTE